MNKPNSIIKGSRIIDEIFWELLNFLKSKKPLTEKDLALQIRKLVKMAGAQGMAFPPIVSFGPTSSEIHHKPSTKRIGRNNFLMLDFGVKVRGFCSDFTRTLFLGKPNKLQQKIYKTVLKAQTEAIKKVEIGANCAEIDLAARNIIAQAGYAKFYIHNTGHGVGKKIHELPNFSPLSPSYLSPNLIMTVEPGIYLPGKFGVRIEDMVLLEKSPKVLSKIPKDFRSIIIN